MSHCSTSTSENTITNTISVFLTRIVTEYPTNQLALCNNPMSTCSQFDQFVPHKRPDPKPSKMVGINFNLTARPFVFIKAHAGCNTIGFDRRFVHSQFEPAGLYADGLCRNAIYWL